MLIRNFRIGAAVTATLACVAVAAPAQADGLISDVVKGVVDTTGHLLRGTVNAAGDIVDTSGQIVGRAVNGTVDATGNILDASGNVIGRVSGSPIGTTTYTTTTVSPDTVVLSDSLAGVIDSRRLAYDAMINDAIARNTLNPVQAAEYRATLRRIALNEANAQQDRILTYDEALALGRDLDSLGGNLYTYTRTTPWTPLIVTTNGATRLSLTPTYYASTVSSSSSSSSSSPTNRSSYTSTTTTTSSSSSSSVAPAVIATAPSTVVTTTLPATTTTYITTAQPEILVTTIETRRKNLDRMIDVAREQGKITRKQAEAMKDDLHRIARETGSNRLTYAQAVAFAQDLDLIGSHVGMVVVSGVPAYVPIINGSHFTVYNGQILQLDDLSVRRADLEARITKDYLQGRLSASHAATLRAQLDAIGNNKAVYDATGQLDFKVSKRLYSDMDKVASELERFAGKDNN